MNKIMKIDNIKKAVMPNKIANVVVKLKENREKNKGKEKIDLGEFAHDLAVKQLAEDKK
jgi:hypothetical protein